MATSRDRSSSAVSSSPIVGAILGVDPTGVQAGLHRHQADAGLGVALEDGPLHRRRPPPPGQQREVEVDHGEAVEDRHRDDPAVGHHHPELGTDAGDVVQGVGDRPGPARWRPP